jgi:glycosyltransferase involved in cell wall biosynthesis
LKENKPKLIIAGDGPDKAIIEKLSRNNKLIEYWGYVSGKKKDEIFRKCKVLVLPSRFETFPLVVAEALSYGLVVVSYEGPWLEYYPEHCIIKSKYMDIQDLSKKLSFAWENYQVLKPNAKDIEKLSVFFNKDLSIKAVSKAL